MVTTAELSLSHLTTGDHTLVPAARERRTYAPSPMDAVVKEAARKLSTLQMAKLSLEPEQSDVANVLADIEALTDIFDAVISELGEYAGSYFGASPADIKAHFNDQVRGALEGNATFVIEEAYREMAEERRATSFENDPYFWDAR